ncbi:hypothetical protein BJ741DRAFT_619511 [Chytriomyces cf. hyalinus JEL632]|nr:hypothetical protein BJ741DRAFT_619511 [Chytriomyces cf. hyalinus JEL632]
MPKDPLSFCREPSSPSLSPPLVALTPQKGLIHIYLHKRNSVPLHPSFTMIRTSKTAPVAVINFSEETKLLSLSTRPAGSLSDQETRNLCISAVRTSFSHSTCINPDRLVYSLAGKMFYPWSPLPFGGTRTSPGFVRYQGTTAASLLEFIVAEALEVYHKYVYRDALDFLTASANEVLALQEAGAKDEVDELVLKGMKKSGRIDWFRAAVVPRSLRENRNLLTKERYVEFTPHQRRCCLNGD